MGIHGIYKEIGPGKRVALSKLAVDKFEETGRPLRIAIDTSIWLFQIQASKGGTNPALRTFYYRLLRLIALAIHPVFVFDGPNKPPFKRNKRTGPNVASIPEFLAKQLLKQFGYPIHLAPGEAEAECALLQREGIVDAVLSEDVDTLMFGSGITIRNWSPEKSGKTPTHVNVYDAVETKMGPSRLDREGMILVALMSGGDYVPEGIPGCGPKTACEAAKAGFGHDLCKIPRNDARAMAAWRERLQHELKTNESKMFKRKHTTLKIPDDFPRLDILGYYTHPAISNQIGLERLRHSISWDQDLDYAGLRDFTKDAFDWTKLEGAKHFVRSLAPCLLVRGLRMHGEQQNRPPTNDVNVIQEYEALLIKAIHGKRQHAITDNVTELRVSFTPIELVKIDLSVEEPDDDIEPPPSSAQVGDVDLDDDVPLDIEDEGPKKRGPTKFDPRKPARVWVLETFMKVGVPLKVQDWEAERRNKLKPRRPATAQDTGNSVPKGRSNSRRPKSSNGAPQSSIQRFTKVTKPGAKVSRSLEKVQESIPAPTSLVPSQNEIVAISSSSPAPPTSVSVKAQPSRNASLSPVLEALPNSVTKRRRRRQIQRSHTLPADTSLSPERFPTSHPDIIETLDLLSSPNTLVQLPLPSMAPKSRATAAITARALRETSITSSPGRTRQATLNTWPALMTPSNFQYKPTAIDSAPIPAPEELQTLPNSVDTIDLTLSSPIRQSPTQPGPTPPTDPCRTSPSSKPRPPLSSISSNTSLSAFHSSYSTASTTKPAKKKKSAKEIFGAPRIRRTSPRLQRSKSTTSVEAVDLTSPQPSPASDVAQHVETVDLCILSSSPPHPVTLPQQNVSVSPEQIQSPHLHRSPRYHRTVNAAIELHACESQPAAWKARESKKRQIILRKSVIGAWDFVDVESSAKDRIEIVDGVVLKEKERRVWRESEVEVLDLS